mmetsp:Transcript_95752/g.194680  ORF Transcript_95752/g.194680 Transcript_95752/m.194680 type:complete len:455 (-) Transcript_95752:23-1387(-)
MWAALLFLLVGAALPPGLAEGPQAVEIEFEPMDMPMMLGSSGPFAGAGDGPPPGLLEMLSGRRAGGPSAGVRTAGAKGPEDDLDRSIQGMLGSLLDGNGPIGAGRQGQDGQVLFGAMPGGMERSGPSAAGEMMFGPMPAGMRSGRSTMPVQTLRDLFPGPLIVEAEGGPGDLAMPFESPDPLIMDMLQDIGHTFQDRMLPMVHSVEGRSRAPAACQQDLKAHCSTARSQVHCLGQHTEDISEACRKDVGKSVPFVCSQAIDRFCDVLRSGVLPCLSAHLEELSGTCRDAVVATRDVITKAQTQKASVVDPSTGEKKVATPPAPTAVASAASVASGAQREASLDAALRGRPASPTPSGAHGDRAGTVAVEMAKSPLSTGLGSKTPSVAAAKVATLLTGAVPAQQQPSAWGVVRGALVLAAVVSIVLLIAHPDSLRAWRSSGAGTGELGKPLKQFL